MSGRIPQYFIDELVSRADIVELIGSRIPLKKHGKEFKACCPFHGEKTPSFTVVPDKGFYHCFGCGAHGTALGFLMEHDHLSFVEAVEEVASRVGLDVPHEDNGAPRTAAPSDALFATLEKAADLYRQELHGAERGKDYFKARGLSGDTAARFNLGYAPEAWDFVLRHLGGSEGERQRLLQVGLTIERDKRPGFNGHPGYYDRFRDRVMFPIRDARGRTIGFGGRVLDKGEPKYLNSPETELFHKGKELYGLYEARQASRTLSRIMIVEGYMDVVRLHQAGVTYAVATLGTATTPEHLTRVFRVCQEVVFCFDGDRAGKAAAWRALENSLSFVRDGRQIRFLFLPDGHDPDSLVGAEGREAFENRIQNALPLSEYFLRHLREQVDMTTRDGRARFKELARPLIERIPEGAFREQLQQDIDRNALLDTGLRAIPRAVSDSRASPYAKSGGRGSVVRQAIRTLVHYPQIALKAASPDGLAGIDRPGIPLLMELLSELQENPCANTASLLERWRGRPDFDPLFKLASSEYPVDEAGAARELNDALAQLFPERGDQRLEELLRKQSREGLSNSERAELQGFLTRPQSQGEAGRGQAGHRT
ncbi:MAG TPA: DNA primase [Povalibacter sp.]|uniref:DNA primase n=1 Tax=Povalibacter sp. TaxID=1962978 RepID=UPI002C1A0FFB|nr:DNA primase [Povalibacter sp.]HMN44633.1 DNA primase [Povalibacter sp.]